MTDSTQQKPIVYVIDPYHEDAIRSLQAAPGLQLFLLPDVDKAAALANADAILMRSDSCITAEDLHHAGPRLKHLIKQGVGVDNVDLNAAKAKGVGVFNTPGTNSEAVAELALTLALCIARRVTEFDHIIRAGGRAVRSQMLGKSLFGKTIGIIGMGAIGFELAKKWRAAMNGSVVGFDPVADADKERVWSQAFGSEKFARTHDLHSLLTCADVVSLHTPLNTSTRNMLSEREFKAMKKDAILLNCARGGVVDEQALFAALQSGKLFGAGLDALLYEPPTMDDYSETLLSHPRVVMTPHIGASTEDSQSRSGCRAVEILLDLLAGRDDHKSLA
jgi:D-3-phosphoglycerate dehydrogenase / 2-oxoglutarate reductase